MNKVIDCKCGIYSTEYRLICHKDGSVSVKRPFIKWVNNSGSLTFETVAIREDRKALVLKMFQNGLLYDNRSPLTLDNICDGY